MKNRRPRAPKREEKILMNKNKLTWNNWLVIDAESDDEKLVLQSKRSGHKRTLDK